VRAKDLRHPLPRVFEDAPDDSRILDSSHANHPAGGARPLGEGFPRPAPVAIVTLKHRTLSPVVALFLDRLRAYVQSMASAR